MDLHESNQIYSKPAIKRELIALCVEWDRLFLDGGDGDWCRHRDSSHRDPHLLHLEENPAPE